MSERVCILDSTPAKFYFAGVEARCPPVKGPLSYTLRKMGKTWKISQQMLFYLCFAKTKVRNRTFICVMYGNVIHSKNESKIFKDIAFNTHFFTEIRLKTCFTTVSEI